MTKVPVDGGRSAREALLDRMRLEMGPLGIGTWSWGDTGGWGYGGVYDDTSLEEAFEACVAGGVTFFDTAEIYGGGHSERLLGRFAQRHGAAVSIATKFAPYRYRLMRGTLPVALWRSLRRLRRRHVELYQIHWPSRWVSIERWMTALAETVQNGMVGAVGVSNYSRGEMLRAERALVQNGLVLASNQVEYSLLCRGPETNGVLDLCKELGATLIAYSPLGMGLLSGKYSPDQLPTGGHRNHLTRADLARIGPLLSLIGDIGVRYGDKTPAQVALNWVICKGAVPIPGVKNAGQALEALGALGWRLSSSDVAALDQASSGLQASTLR